MKKLAWVLLFIGLLFPTKSYPLVNVDQDSNNAVDVASGGTNATTAAAALTSLGAMPTAFGSDAQYDIPMRGASAYGRQATGSAFAAWLSSPTLANLASWISDDGTGSLAALANAPNAAGGYVTTDGSAALTNKTLHAESTGNVLTTVEKVWVQAAGCNNTTAASFLDLPTSNAAAAACVTGTNTQKGVLDFDAATDESAQFMLALPADAVELTSGGGFDADIVWFAAATSGSVVWNVATSCVADAETDDPSWNTASAVTDAAKGTTLQMNTAAVADVTMTGCAAGELLHIKISRNADDGSDDMAGDARLVGLMLSYRRAQ